MSPALTSGFFTTSATWEARELTVTGRLTNQEESTRDSASEVKGL